MTDVVVPTGYIRLGQRHVQGRDEQLVRMFGLRHDPSEWSDDLQRFGQGSGWPASPSDESSLDGSVVTINMFV